MANARKCDRCGKCYDPFGQGTCQMTRFSNPIFQSSLDIRSNKVGFRLVEDKPDAFVDLCPDCTDDFILFMKGNPMNVDLGYLKSGTRENAKEENKTEFQKFLKRIDKIGEDLYEFSSEKDYEV